MTFHPGDDCETEETTGIAVVSFFPPIIPWSYVAKGVYQTRKKYLELIEENGVICIKWDDEEMGKAREIAYPMYEEIAVTGDKYAKEAVALLFDFMKTLGYTW